MGLGFFEALALFTGSFPAALSISAKSPLWCEHRVWDLRLLISGFRFMVWGCGTGIRTLYVYIYIEVCGLAFNHGLGFSLNRSK